MDLKLKDNALLSIDNMMNVDYILASGQCNTYLLTLATNNNYYIIDLDIEVISNTTEGAYVFQATKGSGSQLNYLQCTSTNADTFNWSWATNASGGSNTSFSGRCKIRIKRSSITKSSITINGTSTTSTFSYGEDNYTHPLYLLPSDGITMKIWSIQIYKVSSSSTTPSSSNIIANFVPRISYNSGHYGEAALYDTISNTFKHSSSTGSFTASADLRSSITTAFIKECPNIPGINVLRQCTGLTRVRIDIGSVTSSLQELMSYSSLTGYDDDYEEQVKPKLVGTWTINNYHTIAEREAVASLFDGLTIQSDNNYLAEYLLENDLLAVQTLDSTKPNYNPAVAIILNNQNKGNVCPSPLIQGEGRFYMSKAQAAVLTGINTWFRGITSVTDVNGIVTSDTTISYDFETFNEFQYFTSITSIGGGGDTTKGIFQNCTKLEEIILPTSLTTITNAAFCNASSLKALNIPSTVTSINWYSLGRTSSLEYLYIPCSISDFVFKINNQSSGSLICGKNTGNSVMIVKGAWSGYTDTNSRTFNFNKIICYSDVSVGRGTAHLIGPSILKVLGTFTISATTANTTVFGSTKKAFVEFMGQVSEANTNSRIGTGISPIVHLGRTSSIISALPINLNIDSITTIYVGRGVSKSDDQAIFDLYNADSNWSAYCGSGVPGAGKIDLWYNYHGIYRTYTVTNTLTNCTNSNPVVWPYITRGESYQTTIVPDEGYSLQNSHVTIEMLDTDTTSPTYDTMIDVTADCTLGYDPGTGEVIIQIPSVTGNVVITANAS